MFLKSHWLFVVIMIDLNLLLVHRGIVYIFSLSLNIMIYPIWCKIGKDTSLLCSKLIKTKTFDMFFKVKDCLSCIGHASSTVKTVLPLNSILFFTQILYYNKIIFDCLSCQKLMKLVKRHSLLNIYLLSCLYFVTELKSSFFILSALIIILGS